MSSSPAVKSPLDAAQKIVGELTSMTAEHQALALKFAMETLGLQLPAGVPAPPPIPLHPPEPNSGQTATGSDHSTDIRSFTAMKAPKSDQQFAAVVAYFYQLEAKPEERKEAIDADIMRDAARLAPWPQRKRWGMTLTNAKNAGYLDATGNGKFKLSSVGENLVAITLPGEGGMVRAKSNAPTKGSKKRRPRKSGKKKR